MRRRLWKFLSQHPAGRRIVTLLHPRLHRGMSHPLRFMSNSGCQLCRFMAAPLMENIAHLDALADRSRIQISEPQYNEDGTLRRHGISMSGTFKRQLDELLKEDPERAAAVQRAMDEIARDPGE